MLERKEGIVAGAAVALVLYTLSLSLFGPMVAAALRNQTISNVGSVMAIGVGVYWDQACTNAVSSINWGVIDPGLNVNKTTYIRNEGNTPATLSMTTSNWNPSDASDYMTLSWDYGGQTLAVNEVSQVKLTLSVSPDITGITDFSFDITIAANA
jgi:hypothetical protein